MSTDKQMQRLASRTILAVGLGFLYAPILALMAYSFNDAPSISVWSTASWRWYQALIADQEVFEALAFSLKIAVLTATASVFFGTWIGYVMARYGAFAGHTVFHAMVSAPLVIPEVILGIALLLLFVFLEQTVGWPSGRGMVTMWIGHVLLCVSFVAIVIQSRVRQLDRSLEDAAMDLGANKVQVFIDITLPLLAQALVSGWLLAFTISIDDLILSSYLSGPGTITLPMLVFSRVRNGITPEINALATVMICIVTVCIVVANLITLRMDRKHRL